MKRPRIMQHVWRLGWPGESPVRHYLWGVIIAALGALTILGYVYLFRV
jgi:hypothetical protein